MDEAVDERGGHDRIAEDLGPGAVMVRRDQSGPDDDEPSTSSRHTAATAIWTATTGAIAR